MIRVGVIRGGISSEYDVSLATGGTVLSHLRSDKMSGKYKPIDILIDKNGAWHTNGRPTTLDQVSDSVDVVFNALHGDFGEDGSLQKILDQAGIPYTGSTAYPSSIGYNKALAKEQFESLGINTPRSIFYRPQEEGDLVSIEERAKDRATHIWKKIPPPWVVKPASSGSSFGVKICRTYPELVSALIAGIEDATDLLVEEMIEGKEATVAVVEGFRGMPVYTLPPIEIRIPSSKAFFDYDAKYTGISEEICPGNFTMAEKKELERLASLIHTGLGLSHYSRSDFIIHPKKGIYALEVNTLPGLTDTSLTPKALVAVGSTLPEFLDHILTLAMRKRLTM